jgi:glycogen(starch) synthase
MPARPLGVLVVGWFPRADDQIAGRFIADQVAALEATGRVRPTVVSADPIALHGDLPLRTRAADVWARAVRDAAADGSATLPSGAFGPDTIPVARIGVPVGRTARVGRINEHDHRAASIAAFLAGHPDPPWSLVHAHVGYPEGAAAARVARARGLPLVLTEHATYLDRLFADPEIRTAYLDGARSAARIVAVGGVLADRIEREFPELAGRITVIPNTVDLDSFTPAGPAERDPDELLWVGYRREVKGMATLLRAFAAVRAARPATTLRLIGRSPTDDEEAGWIGLAAELGVADGVRFEPPADRVAVAAAMARAALFVHPSRRETMGIVAVEALASGLPVVAADSGGVTEVLGADPAAVGALVPPDDPDALAAAILATLARRATFDPAALRAHVERFGAAAVAGRIADLYDGVLAAHGGGDPRASERSASRARPAGTRPAAQPSDLPVVLVAFDRPALDRYLAAAPAWATAGAAIVTAGPALPDRPDAIVIGGADAEAVAELLRSSPRARTPGIGGLLAAGPRWAVRRWRRYRLLARVMPLLSAAVDVAVDAAVDAVRRTSSTGAGGAVLVVCAGGIDVLASGPARDAGRARIAAGGLRWLGDLAWVRAAGGEMPAAQEGDGGGDGGGASAASDA